MPKRRRLPSEHVYDDHDVFLATVPVHGTLSLPLPPQSTLPPPPAPQEQMLFEDDDLPAPRSRLATAVRCSECVMTNPYSCFGQESLRSMKQPSPSPTPPTTTAARVVSNAFPLEHFESVIQSAPVPTVRRRVPPFVVLFARPLPLLIACRTPKTLRLLMPNVAELILAHNKLHSLNGGKCVLLHLT